ncbi:Retinol-binding protein pinta [Frankliniella fusca]|uniref:Retinol-binding protein pinta n=1 Tax=Frankliniella fusca TaxID=407009 RepID=A0AAE1H0M3_9NEOP|nr:Retinol-binding protein pinta [Frankliniella fusca]
MQQQGLASRPRPSLLLEPGPKHLATADEEDALLLLRQALRHAAEHLNEPEDEDAQRAAVEELRAWVQGQPHLNARTDDWSLTCFLRGCKYKQDRARKKITNYYEMRSRVPEWFHVRDPTLPTLLHLLKLGVFLPLLKKDEEGRTVVLIRAVIHDPYKHKQSDVFKIGKMLVDLLLETDEIISIYGVFAVIDLNGVSLGHALQLTPPVIKKAVHAWQDCYPVRTRSMDFINAPMYVNVVLNIFRKFMNDKLKKRVHVHGKSLDSLHKVVSPSILPEEYGGTCGTLQELRDYWLEQAVGKRLWFLDNEKHKADSGNIATQD